MESRNDGLRFPPPWITPAAGLPNREVQPVIIVPRRRGGTTLWTPTQTATEWWGAPYDTATTTIATGVSQLRDRKGNGRNFNQATSGTQPTITPNALNGKAGLTFNGSQWLTSTSSAATWNFLHTAAGAGATIVAVWKAGNSSNPNAVYGLLGTNGAFSANTGFYLLYDDRVSPPRNDRALVLISRGTSGQVTAVNLTADNAHPSGTPVIISHIGNPGSAIAANRSIIRINGVSIQNNIDTFTAATGNASFQMQLGALGNNTLPLTGEIYEIVILPPGTNLATVQLVEGYLAGPVAGWNLQSILAADHPYKVNAPTV
jgi:hypothetical protein